MRTIWGVILISFLVEFSISAPVTNQNQGDSSKQLQELKTKLAGLEKSLKDLAGNIDKFVSADGKSDNLAAKDKETNRQVRDFEERLSPEDVELIKRFRSTVGDHLSAALSAPVGPNPNDGNFQEIERRSQDSATDDFVKTLSKEDQQLLQKLHSKLRYIQDELAKNGFSSNPGEDEAELNEDKRNQIHEHQQKLKNLAESLHTKSQDETINILREMRSSLTKLRSSLDKYTAKRELTGIKETGCSGGTCEEAQKNADVQEVSARILNDVKYAKAKGVNLQDLLRALDAQRTKRQVQATNTEEDELQDLVASRN